MTGEGTPPIRAQRKRDLLRLLRERLPQKPHVVQSEALRPAAVLIPLLDHPDELQALFTRRTGHLNRHAGEICFPGGTVEVGDASPLETALRETREELGIDPGAVRPLGYLPPYHSRSGFHITPVVGLLPAGLEMAADPREVAEVFEVPFTWLIQPHRYRECRIEVGGMVRRYHEIRHGERRIWGVTAGILLSLVQILRKDLPIAQ
ncbi:MAG: CoA pyrophosphatase [Gammaproteobacteria bacterium]|nr:MAG: CoA pyrophosphatase [Gammaproteobacteria bacterium]